MNHPNQQPKVPGSICDFEFRQSVFSNPIDLIHEIQRQVSSAGALTAGAPYHGTMRLLEILGSTEDSRLEDIQLKNLVAEIFKDLQSFPDTYELSLDRFNEYCGALIRRFAEIEHERYDPPCDICHLRGHAILDCHLLNVQARQNRNGHGAGRGLEF
ncbi:uncharacterized protein N7529_009051 [Penicillium soppii]|jgi:hypothetical protein|uniref:uncharacterized protein n=1 Tax=Penicillium soppii TaxID=69789 RepID=UPI002547947C|nr:uncharacterized protein N7529_009051 [Penicillium soppii]KAJ5861741.1 hypothetical protein N7529_009051 [Penicillium soppii]